MISVTIISILLILVAAIQTIESLALTAQSSSSNKNRGLNRLFLDTAVESEWESLIPLGIFHGITTNPTLLERAGHKCTIPDVQALATRALAMANCNEFMCQSWGQTCDEMYDIGLALSELDRSRVVIKVPVTFEGTKAASKLINAGVRVCLTACYGSDQAIVAAGIGAEYIAPYLGRMTDNGKDGMEECRRMESIVRGMNSPTRVLVASIRDVKSMSDLMSTASIGGMDTFTFSPDIARQLFMENLTEQAAADFEAAARRCVD